MALTKQACSEAQLPTVLGSGLADDSESLRERLRLKLPSIGRKREFDEIVKNNARSRREFDRNTVLEKAKKRRQERGGGTSSGALEGVRLNSGAALDESN